MTYTKMVLGRGESAKHLAERINSRRFNFDRVNLAVHSTYNIEKLARLSQKVEDLTKSEIRITETYV